MDRLFQLATKRKIQKKTNLLREGSVTKSLYFIESGLIRVYYLRDGKEITDWFGTPGTFITSVTSYYSGQTSSQYIDTVLDSDVYEIKKRNIEEACLKNPDLELIYSNIITEHLIRLQERVHALQFFSAKERYQLLLYKNPEVPKFASRTQIVSYLGIILETLSRVTAG